MDAIQAFNSLLREHIHPWMKAQGFQRSSRTFGRRKRGNWQIINLQGVHYNTKELQRFIVNLGVYSLALSRKYPNFLGGDMPPELACHWRGRLGSATPWKRDAWACISTEGEPMHAFDLRVDAYGGIAAFQEAGGVP